MKRLTLILILSLAAVLVAGYVFWQYFYLGTINIDPIPAEATVSVNGRPVLSRSIRLAKGSYTITISAPGYRSEQFTASVGIGSQLNRQVELGRLPRAQKLIDGPVGNVAMSADKNTLFFTKGKVLYRLIVAGAAGPLNLPAEPITPEIPNLQRVAWAPDFSLAMIHKTDGEAGVYDFKRYDLLHQTYDAISKTVKASVWAKDGNNLYYEDMVGPFDRSLVQANRAGKEPVRVAELPGFPLANFTLTAGKTNILYLSPTIQKDGGDIFAFNAHEKLVGPITESGAAFGPVLSPNGERIAYTDNGHLVVADFDGRNKRNLSPKTTVGGYAFINETQLVAFSVNQIAVIDVTTGKGQTFEIDASSDAVSNLMVAADGKRLYYVFKGDIYQLDYQG